MNRPGSSPLWTGAQGWTGVVLTGGKSSRMGQDKAMLEVNGKTLLDRALDTLQPLVNDLLVIGDPERHGHVGPFVIAEPMRSVMPSFRNVMGNENHSQPCTIDVAGWFSKRLWPRGNGR